MSPHAAARPFTAPPAQHEAGALPAPRHHHLATYLREAAARHGDRAAFTTCLPNGMFGSLTFAEADRRSDAFAAWLRLEVGLGQGARVALMTPNALAYPIVAFGTLKAGCTLVNVNPLYTSAELDHQLRDSGAEVLVVVDMFADRVAGAPAATRLRRVVTCEVTEGFSPVPRAVVRLVQRVWDRALPAVEVRHERLARVLRAGEARLRDGAEPSRWIEGQGPGTLAALQYTGGTTGVSKGAMLSHGNLLANVEQIRAVAEGHTVEGEECVLTALPLYHVFAFTANLLSFYGAGAHNVLAPSPRPIQNLRRAFENYPITWVTGVNTLFNALLNEEWFTAFPPRTLKAAVAGGAALQGAVAERWARVTGTRIAEGYGLTEASPVVTFNPLSGEARRDSIGVPVPGTSVRLLDDEGIVVQRGEPGELCVSGPQVMSGYFGRPDESAKVLRDGWLHTGDVATMDEDGFLRIVDRKKDMVIVSGFKVFPNEVEDVIARMDAVLECAVVGVPDPATGEQVRAYVVAQDPALSPEAVRAHCARSLTSYKVPKVVELRTELPKSPIGKVLRKELRAEHLRSLASGGLPC